MPQFILSQVLQKDEKNTLTITANPAALLATDRLAVIGVGAPS